MLRDNAIKTLKTYTTFFIKKYFFEKKQRKTIESKTLSSIIRNCSCLFSPLIFMETITNLENFIKLYDIIYLIYDIMTPYSNSELKTLIMTVKEFTHKEIRIIHLSYLREKILSIYCFSF